MKFDILRPSNPSHVGKLICCVDHVLRDFFCTIYNVIECEENNAVEEGFTIVLQLKGG